MFETRLTFGVKLAQSSGITPGDGSSSGAELDGGDSRHVVTKYSLLKLDRIRGYLRRRLPGHFVNAMGESLGWG
jgi:hypothetical protein